MNEFKFDCSTCGQHILAAHEWIGRRINCPSCDTPITIPKPVKPLKKPAAVPPPRPATQPKGPAGPIQVEESTKGLKGAGQKSPASAAAKTSASVKSTAAFAEPQQLRVAVLTPAVKLAMVQSVRKRIASASAWLPGKVKGELAYAAKISNGATVLVSINDPQATRFSLLGAFLLELQQRNVTRTARGRTRLLDQEIPDAIRDVLEQNANAEERETIEAGATEQSVIGLSSHAQCLAVLDGLEELYSHRLDQARAEQAKQKLGTTRLPDLIKKLEKKARVAPEDVATALYHELMEVRRRLDRLESRMTPEK